MRQRGFVGMGLYVAIVGVVVIVLLAVAVKVQTARLEAVRDEYDAFKANVKAAGESQERQTKETTERNLKLAKDKDEDAKRRYAALDVRYKRLLDSGSYRGLVPAASGSATNPARACFDRTGLERAIDEFVAGVAGIAETGDRGLMEVNVLREWHRSITK